MDIVIDFTAISDFFNQPLQTVVWSLFWLIGWMPVAAMFVYFSILVWIDYRGVKWYAQQKKLLLAIDIPRGNMQSPRSVENLFAYMAGAHGSLNLIEIYWLGMFQLHFSLEIVSIEGYTQFIIWTPDKFRKLVESAVYSQYPDAEITEINDYTDGTPSKFPDEEYEIWGAEFIPARKWVYPIKTYPEFEHQFGEPETFFRDPMASLMEVCASVGKGEQLWYQIILIPIGFDWPKECDKEISRVLGEKTNGEGNFISKIFGPINYLLDSIFSGMTGASSETNEQDSFKMFNLKPKEKKQIEALQMKGSKLGFQVKIRLVYLAKKEVKNVPKAVGGFVGFMKQFMDLDTNNIKPDTAVTQTTAHYFFKNSRLNHKKNSIISGYKSRSTWLGRLPFTMNVEELASIWHFPIEAVTKSSLVQKAPGRKAEPPMSLPIGEEVIRQEPEETIFTLEEEPSSKPAPPEADTREARNNAVAELEEDPFNDDFSKGSPPNNLPFA